MEQLDKIFSSDTKYDAQKEIISKLLDDSNLETKTELDKPLRFSVLSIFDEVLDDNKLKNSAKIINRFLNLSFKYLISHDRKGRKEYIEALQTLNFSNNKELNPLNPNQINK